MQPGCGLGECRCGEACTQRATLQDSATELTVQPRNQIAVSIREELDDEAHPKVLTGRTAKPQRLGLATARGEKPTLRCCRDLETLLTERATNDGLAGLELGCQIGDLLIPEPEKLRKPGADDVPQAAAAGSPAVTPKRRDGRSLPPA